MMRRYLRNRRGMTMVEMVVAIGILAILMVGTTLSFVSFWRTQGYAIKTGIASQQASNAMTRMTDFIRNGRQADNGAFPIASVSGSEVVFYGDVDGDAATERIRIFRDGSTIAMGVVQPATTVPATYPVGSETVSVIANDVVDHPDGLPLFSFYDEANAALASPTPATVRMMRVAFGITVPVTEGIRIVPLVSFASLRNLRSW